MILLGGLRRCEKHTPTNPSYSWYWQSWNSLGTAMSAGAGGGLAEHGKDAVNSLYPNPVCPASCNLVAV